MQRLLDSNPTAMTILFIWHISLYVNSMCLTQVIKTSVALESLKAVKTGKNKTTPTLL